jgi:hypothetical protein
LTEESNKTAILVCLENAWELLKDRKLKQTAIASFISKQLNELESSAKEKQNNTILNKNGVSIGQVTQSQKYWAVQFDINGITSNQQKQILNFIQKLFNKSTESVAS